MYMYVESFGNHYSALLCIALCLGMMLIEWREGLFPRDTKKHELVLEIDGSRHTKYMEDVILK